MFSKESMRQHNKLGVPATDAIATVSTRAEVDPSTIQEALLHFQVLQEITHTCCRPASAFPGGRRATDHPDSDQQQHRDLVQAELADSLAELRDNLDNGNDRGDTERKLADTLVRLLAVAGEYDLDLTTALVERLAYTAELEDQS